MSSPRISERDPSRKNHLGTVQSQKSQVSSSDLTSRERLFTDQDPKLCNAVIRIRRLTGKDLRCLKRSNQTYPGSGIGFRTPAKRRRRWRVDYDEDNSDVSDLSDSADPDWDDKNHSKSKTKPTNNSRNGIASTQNRPGYPRKPRRSRRTSRDLPRTPRLRGKARQIWLAAGEPEYSQVNGFDRGLICNRIVAIKDNFRIPDKYSYLVEFAQPLPGKPGNVTYEFVPKSVMHSGSPGRSGLVMAFYLSRLHAKGKVDRPDLDSLEHALQAEFERLQKKPVQVPDDIDVESEGSESEHEEEAHNASPSMSSGDESCFQFDLEDQPEERNSDRMSIEEESEVEVELEMEDVIMASDEEIEIPIIILT